MQELAVGARAVIEKAMKDPKSKCGRLFGKDALAKFDEIAAGMEYNANLDIGERSESGQRITLGSTKNLNAVAFEDLVVLNPKATLLTIR